MSGVTECCVETRESGGWFELHCAAEGARRCSLTISQAVAARRVSGVLSDVSSDIRGSNGEYSQGGDILPGEDKAQLLCRSAEQNALR